MVACDYTEAQLDQIDRLVAEKVMGWHLGPPMNRYEKPWVWVDTEGHNQQTVADWCPTRNGGQAMMVFEQQGDLRLHRNGSQWCCEGPSSCGEPGWGEPSEMHHSITLAICLAALKRAGVEVPHAQP